MSDGVNIAPWKSERSFVWDVTCPDTFATSYEMQATAEAGAVAEGKKKTKYEAIASLPSNRYHEVHVFGPGDILCDLARKATSNDPNSKAYLFQQISVAVQRGNAASVLGSYILCLELNVRPTF